MSDDWKGEHVIRGQKVDRGLEGRRVLSSIQHKKRRADGYDAPAAKTHAEWARWAVYGQKTKEVPS